MRAALLSLIETVPGGTGLRGALPIANGQLAMLHIDLAQAAGAQEILCLIDAVGDRVREIERYAASCGLAFHLVRSVADISVRLASDDDLLIIADGLYVAAPEARLLAMEQGCFVASFIPGDGARGLAERFERIDINHVWAGLACVRARDLVEARDLPADWSVQSALLRLAVQRGYRQLVLPFSSAEARRMAIVRDIGEAEALAVQELSGEQRGVFARAISAGPLRSLAKSAWRARWSNTVLRGLALALPVAGIGLAVVDWSMAALALLIAGRGAGHASDILFGRFAANATRPVEHHARLAAFIAAFIIVTVLTVAASDRLAGLFTALLLPGLAQVLADLPGRLPRKWANMAGSCSLIAFAAALAIPFGALLPVLMAWNLMLVGLLLWQVRSGVLASPPATPHN